MRCRECRGLVILTLEGFHVCRSCGLVQDMGPPLDGSGVRASSDDYAQLAEGGTLIGFVDTGDLSSEASLEHFYQLIRIRLLNKNMYSSPFTISDRYFLRELRSLGEELGLSNYQVMEATRIYSKLVKFQRGNKKIGSVKRIYVVATSLYLVGRSSGANLGFSQIKKVLEKRGYRVRKSTFMRALRRAKLLGLYESTGYDGIDKKSLRYLHRLLDELEISGPIRLEVSRLAVRELKALLQKIDRRKIQGRSPNVIAASLAYVALRRIKDGRRIPISANIVSKVARCSSSAIRVNALLISRIVRNGEKKISAPVMGS